MLEPGHHDYDNPDYCEWCDTVDPDCWLNLTGNGYAEYMHDDDARAAECAQMRDGSGETCAVHGAP